MAQPYLFIYFYQINQNVVGKSAKLLPTRASDMMMIYIYIWCWKTFQSESGNFKFKFEIKSKIIIYKGKERFMGYLIKRDKLCFYLIEYNNSGAPMISS